MVVMALGEMPVPRSRSRLLPGAALPSPEKTATIAIAARTMAPRVLVEARPLIR